MKNNYELKNALENHFILEINLLQVFDDFIDK